MNQHDKILSALTEYDTKQSKKKFHNRYFLGIAFNALAEVESEYPGASMQKIIDEAFEGRVHDFIVKFINKTWGENLKTLQ